VLKLRPDHETAAVFIAGLYEEAGQEKKARQTLEAFLKKNPDAGLALFELGRLELSARDWREAKALFTRSIALSPENVRAWIGLGFACEGLGDRQGAIDAYRNAIKLDPDDRAIRRQLIHLHLRANNPDAAMEETKGLEILGGATETRVTRGIVLYHQGKTAEALAEFNLVLERDPKNHQARFLAGACLARLNHNAEAIAAYQQIPQDSGYHFDARLNLATVLLRLSRHGDALAELDLLEKDDPNDLDLLRIRGAVLSAMGRNEQAEATLQRALKIKPNDPELLYGLAILFEKTDRWKQAIELMEKRLTEEPNDVDALNFIGYTLADRNYDLPRAEKMLARAMELKPYSGHIMDSLGWVLFKLGRFDQALPPLLRALELEPSEAVIADHIGDTYAKLGQTDKAREFWQKALALNPEPPLAAQLKEKLGEK
jgi:tetratricopeptide (TPR) repeat protein